jgi:hypothetical protein
VLRFSTRKKSSESELDDQGEILLAEFAAQQKKQTVIDEAREYKNLKELDLLNAIHNAQLDISLSCFYFKNCELTCDVKNQISILLSNRPLKKIGFENCGLDSFDMFWLKSILNYSYGAKSITLIETLTDEEYAELYRHFPMKHLKTIGLAPAQLGVLSKICSVADPLEELVLKVRTPMTDEQIAQLFDLVEVAMIRKLTISPLLLKDESAYRYFMKKLRTNRVLEELSLGEYRGLVNDLFVILKTENITLTSITIVGRTQSYPTEIWDFVQSLLARNKIIHDATAFIQQEAPEDPDEEVLESINARASQLIADLIEVQEVNYISASQHTITELINKISDSHSYLARTNDCTIFSQ